MRKLFHFTILLLLSAIYISCDKDLTEDWNEVINLYVDAELGEYRPWVLKTDDIHPPKTGISVHFSCSLP